MLTLAVLDAEYAEPGTEVTFVWGEEDGGTAKPTVEPHVQRELRAIVSPVPYVEAVRSGYAPDSWRSARSEPRLSQADRDEHDGPERHVTAAAVRHSTVGEDSSE